MGAIIEWDKAAIAKLSAAILPAAEKAIDALHTDVVAAQVIPFDQGTMQNDDTYTEVKVAEGIISAVLMTSSPQARRLYYHPEYNFQKVNNPNAGGGWLEPWLTGDKADFTQNKFAELYKKEAGL